MKKKFKILSIFLVFAMIISSISPSNAFAAQTPKKYVKSLSISEKSLILNVGQRGAIFYKVNAKGKISKKVTAKTSNSNVKVTIQKNRINILARKVGTSRITIYTQGKNIKNKKVKKSIKISITENTDLSKAATSSAYSPVVTSAYSGGNTNISSGNSKKPYSNTKIDVTKSEWISTIMKLSGYDVHEELFQYDGNGDILYSFTDIANDKNAKMIETAVKYGIIPCQGGAFNPGAAADREFFAVTAVRSIGFATNEVEIEYKDKSDLLYSFEDAIAVQLELLKLSDNKFLPAKAITKEEKQNAENIVSDIMASREINTQHKDIIKYDEKVKYEKDVTDYTIAEQNDICTVNVPAGTSIDKVSEGDRIVLPPADGCSEGIAMTISSTSLSPDGKRRVVTGTIPDDISDFLEKVDIEGEAEADIDGITAVDGVATVEVITGENVSKNSMKKSISGQVNLKDKTMIKYTVKEIETTVSFYLEELKYNIDFNKKGVNEIYIGLPNVLSFDTDYKASKDFSKKIGDIPVNLQGGFSINLEVYLETSVNGQITMNLKLANNIGMQYYNGQFYIEKSCEPSFNAVVDADVDIGAKMQLGMYWMKGMKEIFCKEDPRPLYNVSTKWGLHGDATLHIRNDKYTSYEILTCVDLAYYLYGNINVGDGSFLGDKFNLKKTWDIFTKENSPLKGTWHIENMKKIEECTYKDSKSEEQGGEKGVEDDVVDISLYWDKLGKFVEKIKAKIKDDEVNIDEANDFQTDTFDIQWSDSCFCAMNQGCNYVSLYGIKIGNAKKLALEKIRQQGVYYIEEIDDATVSCATLNNDELISITLLFNTKEELISWNVCNELGGTDAYLIEKLLKTQKKYSLEELCNWQQAYFDYILRTYSDELVEINQYTLAYINNDEIPELIIRHDNVGWGTDVCTYGDDGLDVIHTYVVSYIEDKNLLCDSGGRMDEYYDKIYCTEGGKFKLIHWGNYGAKDNANVKYDKNGNPVYQYYWDNVEISENEYKNRKDSCFDSTRAREPDQDILSCEKVIEEIVKVRTN